MTPCRHAHEDSVTVASLLAGLRNPGDLRSLPSEVLPVLAEEIRALLVSTVCATGGHLGPNLGVVELTIALHRVFDSPHDTLLFDIGHQAYVHKLLTGRREELRSLRQEGGLSGYLSRSESGHDVIENSHASTALSYADGLAKARRLTGRRDRAVVAVIGDGALTGGMAWEALDNIAAAPGRPVVIVLNDNGRSYAPTTGALARHLAALRDHGGRAAGSNVFAQLGLAYIGPVPGHDVEELERALRQARAVDRAVLVHVVTVKGKGYGFAEEDEADRFHTVGVIDPATGRAATASRPGPSPGTDTARDRSWTAVFGDELLAVAEERDDVVAVTASMLRPTGLHTMAEAFPDRVFDVGIAEQHAVTSAAGLALGGLHPVVAVYSTFFSRAFDQVLMDVGLHRLPVTFVLDRAGVTGPDGPSHHGMWDTGLVSLVPGMRLAAPRDPARLQELFREAVAHADGPTLLRIPKAAAGPDVGALAREDGVDILYRGSRGRPDEVLLVAAGTSASAAVGAAAVLEAEEGIGCTVADPRWLLPVNPALVRLASGHRLLVTVEDHVRVTGFGTSLMQACADAGLTTAVRTVGLPHAYLPHGPRSSLLARAGLDADGIVRAVLGAHHQLHSSAVPPGPSRRMR
ncbi:1-deoxy-D-xylulose-5-phosphate synthase [Streptomyces morookaense]|uniref:1-deoxy-D-xylulose-5-phosphate synthase n=1 Tax=Streptomyces morookaense TaxID=1970 RepID=UPI0033E118B6